MIKDNMNDNSNFNPSSWEKLKPTILNVHFIVGSIVLLFGIIYWISYSVLVMKTNYLHYLDYRDFLTSPIDSIIKILFMSLIGIIWHLVFFIVILLIRKVSKVKFIPEIIILSIAVICSQVIILNLDFITEPFKKTGEALATVGIVFVPFLQALIIFPVLLISEIFIIPIRILRKNLK